MPVTRTFAPVPTVEALQGAGPAEPSNLITMEPGTPGVRVLLTRSCFADIEARPFGVTGQAQQATSSSDGSYAYTLTQMLPFWAGKAMVELAPVLLTST